MNDPLLIGVDLGGTNVRSGLVHGENLIKTSSIKISSEGTSDKVISEIIQCIDDVFNKDVKSIGIGVPGILDTKQGIVYDVQNIPSWKEIHLKSIIQQHFNVPVYLNNDANCFAAGEWHYGRGKGYSNVAGLILGTGVAAGLILNNKLYEGRNCGAGEFGMLPYLNHNLEYYCSGNYFKQAHNSTGEQISLDAQNGDYKALDIFAQYAKHLSFAIKAVLYTVDPDIIILGGSVSKAFEYFKEPLMQNLQDFPYKPVIKNILIEQSLIENVAILGAAALFFDSNPLENQHF
ncbi:ROK family protein [Daejeonella oryzae]|uniref:ROK family protein n=1 Tax=Daejeonella oryzae TaxID=1122943 RepID=UPI0003FF6EB5|nr:ROK family protein [Daejeonella oryzae]